MVRADRPDLLEGRFRPLISKETESPIEKLDLEQFTAQNVTDFLAHPERDRGNGMGYTISWHLRSLLP